MNSIEKGIMPMKAVEYAAGGEAADLLSTLYVHD